MEKKYYVAFKMTEHDWNGEVLAVTTNKRHAYTSRFIPKDAEPDYIRIVKTVGSREEAQHIAEEAITKGYKPLVELD